MSIPATFYIASILIALTPGPAVIYIVTRSATQGRAAGLASVAGVALGSVGNALVASLGLATLLALSALAFSIVKFAGAFYLIYLGLRTILAPQPSASPAARVPVADVRRIFMDGVLVALFNPKTAIFFAAFVPQFLDTATATPWSAIRLSMIFVAIASTTDTLYALLASRAGRWIGGRPGTVRAGRFVSGGAFIALGLFTAITGRRASG